ncbi:DUF6716 putative glycosyltransferase [Streptantibioticus silvisoli]|uniref:DUF6716 putative glycosyltransferase n=1 Tax=Streptantibioticus silvisoli TaxID=2705255 RepID=UPI0024A9FAA0|nr:DUF6716 putative glycosyltransferase [Streptantibioticus silvisoli]
MLADSDTRWKWGALTARRIAPEARLEAYLLRGRATPTVRQLGEVGVGAEAMAEVTAAEFLARTTGDPQDGGRPDVVVLACVGGTVRAMTQALNAAAPPAGGPRPVIVTGYVGVVYEKLADGLLLRHGADVVLANSPYDADRFRTVYEGVGADASGVVGAALPFLGGEPYRPSARRPFTVVFAVQPSVPESRRDRAYLMERITRHAELHPERRVVVKLRSKPGEHTTHIEEFPYPALAAKAARAAKAAKAAKASNAVNASTTRRTADARGTVNAGNPTDPSNPTAAGNPTAASRPTNASNAPASNAPATSPPATNARNAPGGTAPAGSVEFAHGHMGDVLDATDLLVTVSSTAALEAMHRGIPTAVVTDLGVREALGNHQFLGSGALASFDELDDGVLPNADPGWLRRHGVIADGDPFDAVRERVGALVDRAAAGRLPAPQPYLTERIAPGYLPGVLARHGLTPDGRLADGVPATDARVGGVRRFVRRVTRDAARAVYRHGVQRVAPAIRRWGQV